MKKFKILMLKDMKIREFEIESEWRSALATLTSKHVPHVPLKWHEGAKQYVMLEVFL